MFICQRQNMYKRYSYETLMIEFINNPEFVTPIYWNYLDDCLPTVGRTKRFNNQIFSNINISNINITAKSNLYWLYRNQNSVFGERRPRNCSQLITIKFTFIYINSLWLIGTRFIFNNKLVFFKSHTRSS